MAGDSPDVLLVVRSDVALARSLARDLRRAFHAGGFRPECADSASDALRLASELKETGQQLALLVAENMLDVTAGVELASEARKLFPDVRTVLLVEHGELRVALDAMNFGDVDYFFIVPLQQSEEQLLPVVVDLLDDWRRWMVEEDRAVRIVGDSGSEHVRDLRDFLGRAQIHHRVLDIQRDRTATRLLRESRFEADGLPLVMLRDGTQFAAPTILELADAVGLSTQPLQSEYDLVIIGAGPAGLAASVYGASEGLGTAVIERYALGGQAGQSSRIENYLGFPNGLTGTDLAQRALRQVQRFGAEIVYLRAAEALRVEGDDRVVSLSEGGELRARAVLLASGVSYQRLDAPGLDRLLAKGVFYGAGLTDAQMAAGRDVVIVGGANSAGQAALNFARYAREVTMVVRSDALERRMSRYLVDRIDAAPNISVRVNAVVAEAVGESVLDAVHVRNIASGQVRVVPADGLFIFIGAVPHTDWLEGSVARDARGFVLSGHDLLAQAGSSWPLDREPAPLETCMPGVFVAGDVRHGSIKRVASAVGEGAMAVQVIHEYLARLPAAVPVTAG
ncbi:MAG TPA: FAD-dependent oxidoreductase [Gaiellaceae bacterium]|nr:FAD-dependent oxidoreductase [Gaiellaceae bacterium]